MLFTQQDCHLSTKRELNKRLKNTPTRYNRSRPALALFSATEATVELSSVKLMGRIKQLVNLTHDRVRGHSEGPGAPR